MAYTKTVWSDRIVDKPLTYTFQSNADGTTTLVPAEGTIVQSGTPITAAALNNLEDGVGNNDSRLTTNEATISTMKSQNVYTGAKGTTFTGNKIEICPATFFTNAGSNQASCNITFGSAYQSAPTVMPANFTTALSYCDVIIYPYIYNVTTTGFSARIQTYNDADKLGTSTAANAFQNYLVFGQG